MWIISGFGTGLGGIQGEFSVLLFIFTHIYSNNLAGLDYKPHRQVYKRIMMDMDADQSVSLFQRCQNFNLCRFLSKAQAGFLEHISVHSWCFYAWKVL